MAIETSVESEFFSNPSPAQKEYLTKESNKSNGDIVGNGGDSGGKSESKSESEIPTEEATNEDIIKGEEKQEEKTISYVDTEGEKFSFTPREWEDEWNKNKVENQWQNLGREKEDMYDRYSGLDFYGKDASKEMSSIGVKKTGYLKGLYAKDESGKYLYEDKLNARKEAREENSPLGKVIGKAVDGAVNLYDKTIGKAVDAVSAYKEDISNKARKSSDERTRSYIDDAKLLANSNLNNASKPTEKVALEYDASKMSSSPKTSVVEKPEVKMKVEGIEKPITKTQVEEIKKNVTKDMEKVKSEYEENPSKTLSQFTEANSFEYYDESKLVQTANGKSIPTGSLTTKSGYDVYVFVDPKGDFSVDNLKSMFGIGHGRQIGTATIGLEDGNTVTYTLHEDPKVNDNITVVDESGKQVGIQINANTPQTFMKGISDVFDKIPGQAVDYTSPTVKGALEKYTEYMNSMENNIASLDNAQVDMESLSNEWDKQVENSTPTAVVSNPDEKGEIVNKAGDIEKALNQFTKQEDKEVATEWYNTYTPRIEEAIEAAKADPVGNAGSLAQVLEEAREALAPYANEDFTNFNKSVNDYVGAVAGTYFIETQLYDRGVTADNTKENIIDRAITAYKSDEMSFGQGLLYTLGFGSKRTETDKGVMQLRSIAEQSLGRTSGLSPSFKGAVMSSLMAQSIDNKNAAARYIKDGLVLAGIAATDAMSGFNPAVVGIMHLYATTRGFERYLEETSESQRSKDNASRLEAIKSGKDAKAMPTTGEEEAYNSVTRGSVQDIKNMSFGAADTFIGVITMNPELVAKGVYEMSQVKSLNEEVKNFVGEENLQALESMKPVTPETSGDSESTSEEKKKRKVDELEEVVTDGNKQDGLDGMNLPPLSDEYLKWLINQPYMENYNYESLSR